MQHLKNATNFHLSRIKKLEFFNVWVGREKQENMQWKLNCCRILWIFNFLNWKFSNFCSVSKSCNMRNMCSTNLKFSPKVHSLRHRKNLCFLRSLRTFLLCTIKADLTAYARKHIFRTLSRCPTRWRKFWVFVFTISN